MKHLLEISKIVTKKKVRKIEIFDDNSLRQKNSKFNEFYEAIMAGKFRTDIDAANFLYSCNPTDDKYRQLKSRFKKRLLNTLFFLDINVPSSSNYNRAYFSCNKEWTLVKILLSNKAYHTAAHLGRHILTTALKFKFADVIVNCARILREYTVMIEDEKLFEQYDQYCKQYQNILEAEIRSEELYQRVIMNYYKPASKATDLTQKIGIYCDALVGLAEMYESPVVIYNRYMVWAYRYEMLNDYENVLKTCEAAEKYIDDNPKYYREDKLAEIAVKILSALLHLNDYKKGKEVAVHYTQLFKLNEVWYTLMEYHFLLAMKANDYGDASQVLEEVVESKGFSGLASDDAEKWKVFEMYLAYAKLITEGEDSIKTRKRKRFKLKRFLEEPILYPKGQRIFTILLVIGQVLFFLEQDRYGEAFERVERLKGYANRQLKKEEHFRMIQFIRLLQQLAKAHFNYKNIGVHKKYHDRLLETPFKYRGLTHEIEVLPYEYLWNLILERTQEA
ncbi:MAG: hypothetical protein GY810_32635 [Aureispira sp.]|nr:hypothetical protein [Aureispira sp.]